MAEFDLKIDQGGGVMMKSYYVNSKALEHQERGPQSTSIDSWLEEYFCHYCGDKNDESFPLVENIKGQLVCECCIDGEEQL